MARVGEANLFSSLLELEQGLRASGYIADRVAISTVYPAAMLHKPLLQLGKRLCASS
jgi:hypothetical protein